MNVPDALFACSAKTPEASDRDVAPSNVNRGDPDTLYASPANRSDLEHHLEAGQLRMSRQVSLGRPGYPPLLLGPDRLRRVAEAVAGPVLHFAEDEPVAPARDDVELVASCSDVCSEDAISAEPVVTAHPPLGCRSGCVHSAAGGLELAPSV